MSFSRSAGFILLSLMNLKIWFNTLVLKLEDNLSNQEILTHKDNYIKRTDVRTAKHRHQGQDGRVIFELIGGSKKSFGAKQILLSVCDGYFVKHPTKTYLWE